MLLSDKPKRDGSQWPIKSKPCPRCANPIFYRLKPTKFCSECAEAEVSSSGALAQRRFRQRKAAGLSALVTVQCGVCGHSFETKRKAIACGDCRREVHAASRRAKLGTEQVGVRKLCQFCGAEFVKKGKRQLNCEPCGELSRKQKLPHQVQAKREWFAEYGRERRKRDPKFAMNYRMNANIKNSLRDGKNGRRWESLVGYTITDLMAHLEARFLPGMSWDNRGEWHIDHIRPLCSFSFQTPDDPQFREAWALTNLQPLWAIDNLSKGGRWAA